jgi:hypothetical protein
LAVWHGRCVQDWAVLTILAATVPSLGQLIRLLLAMAAVAVLIGILRGLVEDPAWKKGITLIGVVALVIWMLAVLGPWLGID